MMKRLAVVAAAALLAAACGDDDRDDLVRNDSAAGEVASEDVAGAVLVTLSEWKLDAPLDTLPPGKYTFRVENSGTMPHALEIEGNGKEWETGDLKPGSASELTVELTPGTYELYCPVEKGGTEHEDKGMKRSVVVRAS